MESVVVSAACVVMTWISVVCSGTVVVVVDEAEPVVVGDSVSAPPPLVVVEAVDGVVTKHSQVNSNNFGSYQLSREWMLQRGLVER